MLTIFVAWLDVTTRFKTRRQHEKLQTVNDRIAHGCNVHLCIVNYVTHCYTPVRSHAARLHMLAYTSMCTNIGLLTRAEY